jgi:ribosomal protein S18 acetylase RimI-like enzyme
MNPARDLGELADLIEVAFAADLEAGGRSAVDEIRSLQWMGPLTGLVGRLSGLFRDVFIGYVWVEGGHVVGNVTISRSRDYPGEWTISNVAVYPEFRRRGIARRLMEAAIEHILDQDSEWITLQVRSDNAAAKALYESMGFESLQTFSEMHALSLRRPSDLTTVDGFQVVFPTKRLRDQLFALERLSVCGSIRKVRPLREGDITARWSPELVDRLGELFRGEWSRRRYLVGEDGAVVAAVHLGMILGGGTQRATFLLHPDYRGSVEDWLVLILLWLRKRWIRGAVVARVPVELARLIERLQDAGFKRVRVLDVMGLSLHQEISI